MKTPILLSLSLTLLLAACSPQMTAPNQTANQPGGQTAAQSGSSASAQAGLEGDLTSTYEDEAYYNDTAALAESEAGFGLKALNADARVAIQGSARKAIGSDKLKQAQARIKDALTLSAAEKARLKARLLASKAVDVNGDGTLTIDTADFRRLVQAGLDNRRQAFRKHLLAIDARLDLKHDVAKAKLNRLHHKDHTVRISDKVSVQNADGSVTETVKVNFANARKDVIRETILSKTTKDNVLISVEFELKVVTQTYEHTKTRVATYDNDGGKHVLIEADTKWKNGKTRSRDEERLIEADGSGTGTGTIVIKKPDGTVKTWNYTISFEADGSFTSRANSPDGDEVVIEAEANGDATVITEEDGVETATEVNLDAEANAEAS